MAAANALFYSNCLPFYNASVFCNFASAKRSLLGYLPDSSRSYAGNRAESRGIIQPGNILANPKLRNLYNARLERTRREKQHGGRNITFPTRSRASSRGLLPPPNDATSTTSKRRKKEGRKKKKKKNKKKEKKYTSVEKRASSQAIEKQIVPPV